MVASVGVTVRPRDEVGRRTFCARAAACAVGGVAALLSKARLLHALAPPPAPAASATRPDVGAIDHDRILRAAERYLGQKPVTLTALACPRCPGTVHDYYSEGEPDSVEGTPPDPTTLTPLFTAHRDALFTFGLAVPALAGAYLLTGEQRYAEQAVAWLRAWLVESATRMTPRLDYGQTDYAQTLLRTKQASPQADTGSGPSAQMQPGGRFQGILETLPLVEVALAIPFLAASAAFSEIDRAAVNGWFAAYLKWLTEPQDSGPRLAALARDSKDHHGSSWLLQASAYTVLGVPRGDVAKAEDSNLAQLRHRYKTVTLRAQISAQGPFPRELVSATPYRDSLFNLDLLAGVCHLLSTRFESLWDYSLADGPGMRSAIAYHYPFIADRSTWPYKADLDHFKQMPGRRAGLLFCASAYARPEYAALWKTLPADPASPEVLRTLPIHQPLLWVRQPMPARSLAVVAQPGVDREF